MELTKEAISVRLCYLNGQLSGRGIAFSNGDSPTKRFVTKEALLDSLTVLYEECNNDTLKKNDEFISKFVDKYRPILTELKQLRVNISDFDIKDLIGRGHFGHVHVVREKSNNDVYAMKILKKDVLLKHQSIAFFEEERDIMALSNSEWLVKLYYAFQDMTQLYLVMEYCPGGDLAGLMERRGQPLLENNAVFYISEILQALKDLHMLGYIHRDLKPDNILIDRCGHLKLADFGSAAKLCSLGNVKGSLPIGTTEYISPEILMSLENPKKITHGIPCDYWSLGIVAYELVTCKTPFSNPSKNPVHVYDQIIKHGNNKEKVVLTYPDQIDKNISIHFKELVMDLLHPNPAKRSDYSTLLTFKVFENIHWSSLRDQVPPFVPIVNGRDDISNFLDVEKGKMEINLNNLKTKSGFNGKNLPFIGFTYSREINSLNYGDTTKNDVKKDSDNTHSSSHSSGTSIFNTSINGTVICLSNSKENEKLLESRKKEIDSLHKQLAVALSKQQLLEDKEEKSNTIEKQRTDLEKDLAELACKNQKLQHQLELEHKERKILEAKSLQLIRCAKKKWKEKTDSQVQALQNIINQYELKQTEYDDKIRNLEYQLKIKNDDYEKCLRELDTLKKIKDTHKENMERSRRLTRNSIVDLNKISQDSNIQVETLTKKINSELEARKAIELELKLVLDNLKLVENREYNLLDTLREERDIHMREILSWSKKYDSKCQEIIDLKNLNEELNYNKVKLNEKVECAVKNESKLMNEIKELEKKLENDTFHLNCQIKKYTASLATFETENTNANKLIRSLEKENSEMKLTLDKTIACEEKHKERVSVLEELVNKLHQNVTDLEKQKANDVITNNKQNESTVLIENIAISEKVRLLQEQLNKLEEQLMTSREECVLTKEELRKHLLLYGEKKAISDCDLDRRFAEKELKEAKEHISTLQSEKRNLKLNYEKLIKDLENSVDVKNSEMQIMTNKLASYDTSILELQDKLKKMEEYFENEKKQSLFLQEKASLEIKSLNENIHKLESDVHLSEERRLKVENLAETYCKETKASDSEKYMERENRIKLELMLNERIKECGTLQKNYKILQEACAVLEEQLIDFEKLIDVQDKENAQLKVDIAALKSDIEKRNSESSQLQKSLDIQKINMISCEAKYNDCVRKLDDERAKNLEMEKQINAMIAQETSLSLNLKDKSSEVAQLNSNFKILKCENKSKDSENASLKEECTRLLTNIANLREANMCLQLELKESKENYTNLQAICKEREEEFLARQYYWQECEMKAEATIAQHIKLIDFLQTKVEEASKRKKTLGDMLFGKSSNKENVLILTPQTPINSRFAQENEHLKALTAEKNKNSFRKSRDAFPTLQRKFSENTPNIVKSNYETSTNFDPVIYQGLLKIEKDNLLVKINMKLYKNKITWQPERDNTTDEFLLYCEKSFLIENITTNDTKIILSESERNLAFKIVNLLNTEKSQAEYLLIVCSSAYQKDELISKIRSNCSILIKNNQNEVKSLDYIPNVFGRIDKVNIDINFMSEISDGIFLIGTKDSSYCFFKDTSKKKMTEIACLIGLKKVCSANNIDRVVLLDSTGKLQHLSLRQFIAFLKISQTFSQKTSPTFQNFDIEPGNENIFTLFEMCVSKSGGNRDLVCASTLSMLYIYQYEDSEMRFIKLRCLKTEPISCMKFTPHTIIVGSKKFYEVDLNNFKVEEFIDPSDTSLSHTVDAYKKNILPSAIIQTKDINDKSIEYLLCFNAFGVFIDEYGQRSRQYDVKWKHYPFKIEFRKPYIFIIYSSSIEIIHLTQESFQGTLTSDSESISSSVTNLSDASKKVFIEMSNVSYLGKSSTSGSIYLSQLKKIETVNEIFELDANDVFKNKLGRSIDTLDTVCDKVIDDKDNQSNLDISLSMLSDTDSNSIEESSIEVKTDFSSKIKEKAKIINSLKQENDKINAIQNLLSNQNFKNNDKSNKRADNNDIANTDSSGDESDLSSSYEENRFKEKSDEICTDKKRVRFN